MPSPIPTVFGIFLDHSQADNCLTHLLGAGFAAENISVLLPDNLDSKALPHDENSKAGSSTSVVTTRVAIGGSFGSLAELSVLAIPGIGTLLIAGPILGALAGSGGIDAFECIGIPHHIAPDYSIHVKEGGLLLTVRCKTAVYIDRAEILLADTGAQHIASSAGNAARAAHA